MERKQVGRYITILNCFFHRVTSVSFFYPSSILTPSLSRLQPYEHSPVRWCKTYQNILGRLMVTLKQKKSMRSPSKCSFVSPTTKLQLDFNFVRRWIRYYSWCWGFVVWKWPSRFTAGFQNHHEPSWSLQRNPYRCGTLLSTQGSTSVDWGRTGWYQTHAFTRE